MKKLLSFILITAVVLAGTISAFAFDANESIAKSEIDFEVPGTDNAENPLGNLIADSYIYEARKKGAEEIQLALVSNGSIAKALPKSDIRISDVFAVFGLSRAEAAEDTLVVLELKGSDIITLAEKDASLGIMQPECSFSYSGLRFMYNSKRISMDRIISVRLYDEFGILGENEIDGSESYTVCCSRATAELLPSAENIRDLTGADGKPISQADALAGYLFQLEDIPSYYSEEQGRKTRVARGDLESIFENPGRPTKVLIFEIAAVVLILIVLFEFIIPRIRRRG